MQLSLAALLALPVALRVAALEVAGNGEPSLRLVPLNVNLQAEVDQTFLDEVCPDYTNYARIKQ